MFVVLSYDIGAKRVQKALKICRKYLRHMHRSVFEGNISEGKLNSLKRELAAIINTRHDTVCIYRIESPMLVKKEQIGVVRDGGEII